MINIVTISNMTMRYFFEIPLSKRFASQEKITYNSVSLAEIYDEVNESILLLADYIVVAINFFEYINRDLIGTQNKKIYNIIFEKVSKESVGLYDYLKKKYKGRIIWFGYEGCDDKVKYVFGYTYFTDHLIDSVNEIVYKYIFEEDIYINLKEIIAKIGINNAYNIKNKYRWSSPYSEALWEQIANEVYKQYLIYKGITKKCIVLDCDNVLWGGILSEDGIENIRLGSSGLGRVYQDFQRFVLFLYQHGVILAISSKNDIEDVKAVFHRHSEMILKEEHIACFMVNWGNKPDSIKRIAETLNIGLDSIVFVDDSPIEIEAVKALLPEITTIRFKTYMGYELFSCFNLKRNVNMSDIEKRNRTYQTNSLREKLKVNSSSYSYYIESLCVKVDIHKVSPIEYNRLSELTQRTNKCTNGKRYTIDDIKERIQKPNVTMYSVLVSDRFSDLGLVGAMEVENNSLTLFSLSCRALGRGVEDKMITYLLENHNILDIVFTSTNKNDNLQTILKNKFAIITN